jgi:transcriptional regulator with XRE-family HTH domain
MKIDRDPSGRAVIPDLRYWIERAGIKQAELAAIVGLSASMISQLANRGKGASVASLLRLAKALGCSVEQLMTEDPRHRPPAPELDRYLTQHAPDSITDEEIAILRAVTFPGRRITVNSYVLIYAAIQASEVMHS